jgi:acylphosphatase
VKRVHVFVSGQVQGVFYRAQCAALARQLGVAGFVRNRMDGRVEAAFEGVDAMVAWCHEGTDWASVKKVDVSEEAPTGDEEFRVHRTE